MCGRNKVVHNYKYCILVLMCFELKIKEGDELCFHYHQLY